MSEKSELESLGESAVLLCEGSLDVLHASGSDRVSFLHRITSGKIAGLETGRGARTLLLDVRGRVLASLLACVRKESVRLLVAQGQGAEVAAGLSKFAIMDDFQAAHLPELATCAVLGPRAARALVGVGVEVPEDLATAPLLAHVDLAASPFGQVSVLRWRACGSDGLLVVANRVACAKLGEALRAAGTPQLSPETAEGLRIAALEPAHGKEITSSCFPVEVGLGAAIDHTKGCYVGQETIVRMRDRGNVRKRLGLLRLDGDVLPNPGDKVSAEGQAAAGGITSVGRIPGERPVALAVVTNAVRVGAAVRVEQGETTLSATLAAESPPWT